MRILALVQFLRPVRVRVLQPLLQVGTVAYPEIESRSYNESLFLASLADGGTLGILVPPSINLSSYGLLTDTSVPELYLAGIFLGLNLSSLFINVIIIACLFRKDWGGQKVETIWSERFGSLRISCLRSFCSAL